MHRRREAPTSPSGTRHPLTTALLTTGFSAALASAACGADTSDPGSSASGDLPQGSEPVGLDPADFTTKIDTPYWPMAPGDRWVDRETDTTGTALPRRRRPNGRTCS